MEKNKETMKKKTMSNKIVTTGGGGLAGIILLGGALATAALLSTFAFKRNRKSKKCDQVDSLQKCSKVVKKDDDGLSFLVQDSLSPQLNHQNYPSNGTADKFVSGKTMILDETSQVNCEKDEEVDILIKERESVLCDESFTSMDEFPVPFADSSLLWKPVEMKKNDRLEENSVLEVDENIMMADSNQVGVADNDQHIPLEEDEVCDAIGKNIDGSDRQLAEAALAGLVGVDGEEHLPAEKCSENREVIIEREEALVEVPQSEQLGIGNDYHKLGDGYHGNGEVLVVEREELVEAAVVDQIGADDYLCKGGEECDADVGIAIEKGEEVVGDDAANGIKLSEKLEFTSIHGDQAILCSDNTIIKRHDNGTCYVNETILLLPMTDSLSLLKPADDDVVEKPLVIEDTKILEVDEVDKTSVQEDSIEVEDRGETQLVEPNEDCKIYTETTNDKREGADEIGIKNNQQMQPCEEFQKNHINEEQKYSSDRSSPEINIIPCNSLEVQEFSFPLLDSPPCFTFGNMIKDDYSETAIHVEKDRSANEIFAYQIMVENEPLVQSEKNDEMKSFNGRSENDVAEGEETLETGFVDISDGSKNDAGALEIIETENFALEKNQQSPLNEENCYDDNVNREEVSDSTEDEENSDSDCDEEDTDDEDEESSETTGGSSLDSNAEAIWPVDSVQEFSQKENHKLANPNFMETEKGDNYSNFSRHKLEEEDKDKLTAEITTLRQPTMYSNLKFWFLSLLVPFLLLLWLLSSQISSSDSSPMQ